MEPTILRTRRLELHPTAMHLLDGIWAAIERSLADLRPWMAWAPNADIDNTRDFVVRAEEKWSTGLDRPFSLVMDGAVVGQCGLDRVDPLANQCEIGYWLRSDLAGRGLMTEAASAVVDVGFTEMGLHRIELHAGIDNAASNRVAQKLGFRREGVLRERGLGAEGYYDMYVYGLLETDERLAVVR